MFTVTFTALDTYGTRYLVTRNMPQEVFDALTFWRVEFSECVENFSMNEHSARVTFATDHFDVIDQAICDESAEHHSALFDWWDEHIGLFTEHSY